jgi:hypothetical protein
MSVPGSGGERQALLGLLALRPVLYQSEARPPRPLAHGNLQIRDTRHREVPTWHPNTGIYGFLHLPYGLRRLHVTDPSGRLLPRALAPTVPDRSPLVQRLREGRPPDSREPAPAYLDLLLRPAIGTPPLPGETQVWGEVRGEDGRPLPSARPALAPRHDGGADTVIGYSDATGRYLLVLPGERTEPLASPSADDSADSVPAMVDNDAAPALLLPERTVQRAVSVHLLRLPPAADPDPLTAFSADFDVLDPDSATGPYRPATMLSIWQDGQPVVPASDPASIAVEIGSRTRWDLVPT